MRWDVWIYGFKITIGAAQHADLFVLGQVIFSNLGTFPWFSYAFLGVYKVLFIPPECIMSTLSLTWQMPPLLKLALFLGLIFSLFIFSFMKMACSQFSWDPYHFLPYCLTAAGLPLLCALLTMRSIRQQAPQQAFSTLGNAPSCLLPKAVKRLIVYFQGCPWSSYQSGHPAFRQWSTVLALQVVSPGY